MERRFVGFRGTQNAIERVVAILEGSKKYDRRSQVRIVQGLFSSRRETTKRRQHRCSSFPSFFDWQSPGALLTNHYLFAASLLGFVTTMRVHVFEADPLHVKKSSGGSQIQRKQTL